MEAIDHLKLMTAWQSSPQLSEAELEALLAKFSLMDAAGRPPTASGWTPTYNLRAAAREAWRWKAARAAELISTDLGCQFTEFTTSPIRLACGNRRSLWGGPKK